MRTIYAHQRQLFKPPTNAVGDVTLIMNPMIIDSSVEILLMVILAEEWLWYWKHDLQQGIALGVLIRDDNDVVNCSGFTEIFTIFNFESSALDGRGSVTGVIASRKQADGRDGK